MSLQSLGIWRLVNLNAISRAKKSLLQLSAFTLYPAAQIRQVCVSQSPRHRFFAIAHSSHPLQDSLQDSEATKCIYTKFLQELLGDLAPDRGASDSWGFVKRGYVLMTLCDKMIAPRGTLKNLLKVSMVGCRL